MVHDNNPFWELQDRVQPKASLQQGDLIVFHRPELEIHRIGIVVTADCDLDKKKHGNLITLVPVLSSSLLLKNYILIDECERQKDEIEKRIKIKLEITGSMSGALLEGFIRGKRQEAQGQLEEDMLVAMSFYLGELTEVSIDNYRTIAKFIGQTPKSPKGLSQQIVNKGDVLALPSALEIGVKENIAWVRHIWQASANDIAVRTSEVAQKPAEKIARLSSPFRYRLTQKLAQVFSDIGLPEVDHCVENEVVEAFK